MIIYIFDSGITCNTYDTTFIAPFLSKLHCVSFLAFFSQDSAAAFRPLVCVLAFRYHYNNMLPTTNTTAKLPILPLSKHLDYSNTHWLAATNLAVVKKYTSRTSPTENYLTNFQTALTIIFGHKFRQFTEFFY